jgi:2-dehydropantoate 2-reductase
VGRTLVETGCQRHGHGLSACTGLQKGRRTEIDYLNGFVAREGEKVGLSCSANAALTDIVKRVERNELSPDPRHITELRLN